MVRKRDYSKLFGTKQGLLKIVGEEIRNANLDGSGRLTLHLKCECECGNIRYIIPSDILNKKRVSCGCTRMQRYSKPNSHGMSKTRFYIIWCGMMQRCKNENSESYVNYGGRGIKICEEWNDFTAFKVDMYESYEKHVKRHGEKDTTIDRLDVNGNYTKENCTWATMKEQSANTRQVVHYKYKGEMLNLSEIARRENINYKTLRNRMFRYGSTLDEALEKSFNTKRTSTLYNYKGEKLTLKEIAAHEGIGYTTLYNRIKNIGLSLEEAINKTPHKKTR